MVPENAAKLASGLRFSSLDDQRRCLACRKSIRGPDAFIARVDVTFYSCGDSGFHFDESSCSNCFSDDGPLPAFHCYVSHREIFVAPARRLNAFLRKRAV